jgi:hypothetical protein
LAKNHEAAVGTISFSPRINEVDALAGDMHIQIVAVE